MRVHYSALNRADTLQRKGAYPAPPGVTDVLGLEAAGEVVSTGPFFPPEGAAAAAATGATPAQAAPPRFAPGMRVMALLSGGGYADYVCVPEQHLLPVPGSFDMRTAAAVPETWLTAFQLLFLVGEGRRGDVVLVHAAGSGVGTAAVQLATSAGMKVIAIAGTDEKLAVARSLGAVDGVNYK